MGFSVGIVGLPNVGKSTLFKALTKKEIDISNYPFCTIDPNVGIVKVPDKRLQKLAEFSKSKKIIPTAIEFIDIAGLVKDAHKGDGLGNKFLSNIRESDMIIHIVRGFEDKNITHINGKTDPKMDIETINFELILADLETINKSLLKIQKDVKAGKKESVELQNILEKYKLALENEKFANIVKLDKNEKKYIRGLQLLTNKPIFYVINVNENQNIEKENILPEIENKIFIPIKFESDLSELLPEEALEFKTETKLDKNISNLDDLIIKCYKLLELITFFTTGENETRAWTIKKNSTAPQAGSAIHGDFEKKFIRANVINWKKLLDSGSWQNSIEQGLMQTEGKEYIVQDGDVIEFKI